MTNKEQLNSSPSKSMTNEASQNGVFLRIAQGGLSFIVGLSAFGIIKLLFQAPIYLMIIQGHLQTVQTLQLPLLFLCIFLAYLCTKKINKIKSVKSRNITRVATIALGIISIIVFPILGLAMR
jgi:hypothetical protein